VLAFLGYTVRVESVWIWLAFMLADGAYSAVFHPLAGPRSYLAFAASLVGHRVLRLLRVADPPFAGASPLLQTAGFVLEQVGSSPAPDPSPEGSPP
jgi:hypothetical protein